MCLLGLFKLDNRCPIWVISRHNGPIRVMSAFTPKADISSARVGCLLSATSRLMHRSKQHLVAVRRASASRPPAVGLSLRGRPVARC